MIQNAVWSGTPVVGIGLQWEQQANIDGLAKAGMAVRIPLCSITLLIGKQLLGGSFSDPEGHNLSVFIG